MSNPLAARITEAAFGCEGIDVLEPARIGEAEWKNELLFFLKPEVFVLDRVGTEKTIALVLEKLSEFGAKIDGICALGGNFLKKNNIMSQHYGYINRISNSASRLVTAEERAKIEAAFGLLPGKYELLGGHEYLNRFRSYNPDSLDRMWFSVKSIKIRSGLYVRHVKEEGADIVLVNGFHPSQLAFYTDRSHRVVLLLLHSNTSWSKLRNEMVGETFPERALPGSIRETLYTNIKDYGFKEITVALNAVHLSAGPFEGMAEIANFFGKIMDLDMSKRPPLLLKRMRSAGIAYEDAIGTLRNPPIEYKGKGTDLFTATEDMDSDAAISVFKDTIGKGTT